MARRVSRRAYLLAVGSTPLVAGCHSGGGDRKGTPTGTQTQQTGWPLTSGPEPSFVVAADGSGDYRTFRDAYLDASAGDVVGLAEGTYSLSEFSRKSFDSPAIQYDSVEKELTVVGRGRSATTLTFDTDSDILSVPSWTFWDLTIEAGGSIVGPRDGKHRGTHVTAPIMDPPGYARTEQPLEGTDATIATSGIARRTSAETTYYGITFDTVLNAVDDLGMDPDGNLPIDGALGAAYETGTLIEFPPGTYRVDAEHSGNGVSRFGLRGTGGSRRDVRFVPTRGSVLKFLKSGNAGPHLIENLSFDELDDDASQLSLMLRTTDGTVIKNVEWLGRTPDDSAIGFTLTVDVIEEDGVSVVDQVYAGLDEPAKPVEYPNGVAFIRNGPVHRGELVLRDPVVHYRNSNATRFTAGPGVVTIEGGEFVNNQNASVRFGAGRHPSKVSSATGTYIAADGSRDSADAIRLDASSNGDAGAIFRDITVEWTKTTGRGVIAFPDWGGHGRAEFYDCVVRNDGASTPTVNAEATSVNDDAVVIENCAFTGSGGGFVAEDRLGSVIRDSCIDMPNASVQGFDTRNVSSSNCRRPTKPLPSPTITATKTGGLTVDLSAIDSPPPDHGNVAYVWNVDGRTYTEPTVSHTFPVAGTYSVSLTVEDDAGTTASATSELIVNYPQLIRDPPGGSP